MRSPHVTRLLLVLAHALAGCQAIAHITDLPGAPPESPGRSPSGASADADAPVTSPDAGSVAPRAASCASMPSTCGPDGGADCCEAPLVPGGTFLRDYDGRDFIDKGYRASVSSFRLDRFEVTVARFRVFVAAYAAGWRPQAGAGRNPSSRLDQGWETAWSQELPASASDLVDGDGDGNGNDRNRNGDGQRNRRDSGTPSPCEVGFDTFTDTPRDRELRPINCVDWLVSFAFCIWDGGRLPSDAEWTYAAAGGSEQRYYPWNADIDETRSSYFVDTAKQCYGDGLPGCARSDLTLVGTHASGAGKWGHADLGGNVAEWVRDGAGPKSADCVDCIDATDADGKRRVRGGAYDSIAPGSLRVAAHEAALPLEASPRIGVRCARTP